MRLPSYAFLLFAVVLSGCVAATYGMAPYKLETVTTINGNVDKVETVRNKQTNENGLHLKLMTVTGAVNVHVCPQWYADKNKIHFSKGESLIITGSTFIKDNEQNIYAASITDRTSHVLKLRKEDTGDTLWVGRERDESHAQRDQDEQKKTEQEMKARHQKTNSSSSKTGPGNNKIGTVPGSTY